MLALKIVRTKEFWEGIGVDRSTMWRWIKQGILEPPLRLGPKVRGWTWDYIEQWLRERGWESRWTGRRG